MVGVIFSATSVVEGGEQKISRGASAPVFILLSDASRRLRTIEVREKRKFKSIWDKPLRQSRFNVGWRNAVWSKLPASLSPDDVVHF